MPSLIVVVVVSDVRVVSVVVEHCSACAPRRVRTKRGLLQHGSCNFRVNKTKLCQATGKWSGWGGKKMLSEALLLSAFGDRVLMGHGPPKELS